MMHRGSQSQSRVGRTACLNEWEGRQEAFRYSTADCGIYMPDRRGEKLHALMQAGDTGRRRQVRELEGHRAKAAQGAIRPRLWPWKKKKHAECDTEKKQKTTSMH